jgi:CheY-like chemotaxis protein
MKNNYNILVVDDEQVVIDAVVKICSEDGFSVDSALDANEAIQKLNRNSYKLIVCDIMMPGTDGFGLMNVLSEQKISTPVIMTTGYSTVENAVKSLLMGAIDFIPKPFTADELSNSVIRGMNYLKLQNMVNNSDSNSDIVYVPCPAKYFRLGNISWVCEENTGSVLIGANDLFVKTINSVSGIELFNTDDEVVQGNACAFIKDKDERMHPLLSPLSGRIIEVNNTIVADKNLVEKDPYFEGWFYRLIPSHSEYELRNLINCSSDRI